MKVTDIRRKLMAALAAGGLLAPSTLQAANLNTNLIVNPGFESVDFAATGAYGGPQILNWSNLGFTYSHDGSSGVPNYANGAPLAGGGSWYFAPGSSGGGGPQHQSAATAITQSIDVSGGPSGTLIAGGTATFNLSGFFNSFGTQQDYGVVQAEFLSAANALLGSAAASPGQQNLPDWMQFSAAGSIPVGTATVKVSAWGVLIAGGSADGYMDNLDFQVSNQLPVLSLNVNRSTGAMTLTNQTGSARNISSYAITSAFEALAPTNWLSITDNYDSGNPGPNQVDPAHAWSETSTTHANLTEADPSTAGASLANGRTVNLGNAWIQTPTQDLAFQYVSGGMTVSGIVNYVGGPGNQALAAGDLNVDGAINSADWTILRTNQHTNLTSKSLAEAYRLGDLTGDKANNHADFIAFKTLFDAANGVGAFQAMVAGVPEPSTTILLVGAGIALFRVGQRRRCNEV
jgi:hypothetical protein